MTPSRKSPLLAALLATVVAGAVPAALAQSAPTPAQSATEHSSVHQAPPRMTAAQLVDGRIAFLKTELKITDAQEAQWQLVANAMRANAQARDQATADARQHRGTTMNAVERMEFRSTLDKLRADNAVRLLSAFKPLYASLSPDQQKIADALMAPHHGGRHGWHHRA